MGFFVSVARELPGSRSSPMQRAGRRARRTLPPEDLPHRVRWDERYRSGKIRRWLPRNITCKSAMRISRSRGRRRPGRSAQHAGRHSWEWSRAVRSLGAVRGQRGNPDYFAENRILRFDASPYSTKGWRRRESNPHSGDATAVCSRYTTSPGQNSAVILAAGGKESSVV